jgi:hypothetical protein
MSVRPLVRTLGAILAGAALWTVPQLSAPASAATAPVSVGSGTTASQVAARRSARDGAYRITVRGWTRTIVRGNQTTINRCHATLWEGPLPGGGGTTWLAGHDYCGFYRWDRLLHVGDRFTVSTSSGAILRYVVTGRGFVGRHSGSASGLIRGDITLQTCRGAGTAFTYARLVRS